MVAGAWARVEDGGEPPAPRRSRLAGTSSAYLRSAADQPIDWYPWGVEAFEVARSSGRPLLVDVGASWCHWCHVMDEGTYSDAEVGKILRQHFVAVKVDRDEHPEVDRRLQRQVSALSGEGGWPLTAFLTSEGEAFFGGTYFPPTDGHGRPGFRRLLREIVRIWVEEPERVRESASTVREALARAAAPPSGSAPPIPAFVERVAHEISASFDPAYGGFGTSPKFPHPTAVQLLLAEEFRTGDGASGDRARETLLAMANGGMYDQLGGGFHRYSTDERWHVPHFEKMGVDNAELLAAYLEGYRRYGDARFEEVIRGTVGWAGEVLGDPGGGWAASQDADNAPGDDGGYFTWSRAELREALGADEAKLVARAFGLGTDARMPHDPERNVLFRLVPAAEAADGLRLDAPADLVLERALGRLREVRAARPAPGVDRALYASINGRFIATHAVAGLLFREPPWLAAARRAADRWLSRGFEPTRGMAHQLMGETARGFGLLEDQVSFATGLLELAVADRSPRYLEAARAVLELVDREYRGEDGLLRDVAPALYDGPAIAGATEAAYPLEDSPHLSANAMGMLAFLRLGHLLHDDRWSEAARRLLEPVAARLRGAGLFAAGAALAAETILVPPIDVVVEGDGPAGAALLAAARSTLRPGLSVFEGRPPEPFALPGVPPAGGTEPARALVCRGTSCLPPITEPEALVAALRARPDAAA
ncbi:MAG TPA: thioredoxin domain-containing protein [Thermoplasmata archaeon]|nr:thioredoxin domain-containing protein [Thermoplasmata archaeon]